MVKKILIIGLVWPEPESSAAGWRMMQLIQFFLDQEYTVHFASVAKKSAQSKPLQTLGVIEKNISINDSSFDEYITDYQPDVVMFDRFVTEEQFGWRVHQHCPNALTILDTEDLHFVRKARELAYKKQLPINYYSADAKREIASILRCDLSLIISEFETNLLKEQFRISPELLFYLPFVHSSEKISTTNPFTDREHFMFIGNCLHKPNYQTIVKLKKDIWPIIKKDLPKAELHIYGAYIPEKVKQLHQPKNGFIIKGRAENVFQTMQKYRVLLAPIPFGAGIKGKFVDAMQAGLPSVTTTIGAEDMTLDNEWCGFVTDKDDDFAHQSVALYQDEKRWLTAQKNGEKIYQHKYQKKHLLDELILKINQLETHLIKHRQRHFVQQILHDNQHNALKYMSKWIEAKNK